VSAPAPPLPAHLERALRRLRLAAIRKLAPELLVVAKTKRWSPEDFLRTLVEAEIAARDELNARGRLKAAAFPVRKTLEQFDVSACARVAALRPASPRKPLPGLRGTHRASLRPHGHRRSAGGVREAVPFLSE
jgi:hypothetical protein